MEGRFQKQQDGDGKTTIAGPGPLAVTAYGIITLRIDTPTGKKNLILSNVHYVPSFTVNVVSASLLADKGMHIDSYQSRIHRDYKTVFYLKKVGGHWLVEDNTSDEN